MTPRATETRASGHDLAALVLASEGCIFGVVESSHFQTGAGAFLIAETATFEQAERYATSASRIYRRSGPFGWRLCDRG